MRPLRARCGAEAGREGWPREPRGSGRIPPRPGSRLALLLSRGSRRGWAPAAAQTARVSTGLAPGPGSEPPPPPPAPPPRAQAALQSRPRGSARPPSPRLRLRLRRARPRLTRPAQLPLGSGRSGSPDAEPGKPRAAGSASERPRRPAARPRRWGGRGGRCFSCPGGRRAPGVRGGAAPPEPGPPARLSARLAESSGRGAAEGRAARLQPRANRRLRVRAPATSPGRRAQQTSPPPRSRSGHGLAGRRAGPRDPQSLLARWARSRGRARARRPLEGPRVPGLGAGAVEPREVVRPRQMPPAKLERRKLQLQGDSDRYAYRASRTRRP